MNTDTAKFDFDKMVITKDGKVITTSLKVAEYFGKRHKDVLRKIENLECSDSFTSAHFCAHAQDLAIANGATRKSKYYEMDFQGFIFLVMGFTGKEAAKIKETYINAFDWMHDQLTNIAKSYMEMMNNLMLQYKQEKSVASFAGRQLRNWQLNKPCLEYEIKHLEETVQGKLLLN